MDDGFTLWESLTEQPALRATASEDEPVILSYSVHYDFPTVTVEPYFTTNTYGESVFVRSFYLNGPAAVEVKGSKVKKNGEPANTNQILTGVKIPANVQAAFEQMKADPSASFTKTAADVGDEFPCPWCSMPLTEDDLVGDDQCPYCHAALDFDGSTGVGQWVMRKGASYAGQGVIGWGFVEKYEDRSVKSHLIIRHADGDYDTACHHKVDCNALTLSNDTPPSWDRCQACQRILDGGAEVPSPFGHITAASRVGQAYLGGTITSIEDDAVIVTYANGEVAKVSKVSWEWNKTGSKVAWDESQHKRQDKGTSDPSGKYRPGQFVPKDSTEVADQGDDTSIFDGGDPGTPAPSTPAEGDEAVLEGDPAQSPSAEAPGVQENGVESPEPEVEDQPDLSMFDIGDDGVMKPPSRHAPVDMAAKNAFAALPTATRDALADPANTVPARVQEIVAPRSESYPDDLREAVDQRMDEIKGVMPPKIAQMARQHMQHLGTLLQAANPQADPAAVQDLMLDACDYLVAQDAEAQGRTLGDHGARHLLTDARVASEVVKLAGDGSPATEAMMYLCGIFHDTGYMAPPARQFLDSDHPRWSRQNYKANVEPKVNAVLGPEVAKEAAKIIVSHDRTEMNWDEGERAASAFRLADNLGLFHADKLPGFCFLVPQNIGIMVQLAEGRLDVEAARTELKANINKAELTGQVKSHLYDAVDEVGAMLPKFMLGMVGTKLGGIEWAGDHPIVHLQRTEANEALSKVLDMGQRQFLKFAETYMGEDEAPKFLENEHFEFKNRRGNLVLESRLNNPMTKDEIKAVAVSIRVRGGWLFDKITQPVYDYAKDRFGTEPSFDWCRFRHDSHCFFPKDLDVQATEQAGYDVWIPIDRGYCPRIKWKQQQECPIGEPGPNSHEPGAGLETWQSYGDGGQRGYASLHTEAASDIVITPRDYLDPMDWPEGYPIERRYSDLSKVYEARNAEGKVMGYARLRQRDIDGVWFVWRIETYPEFQRQGVATAIIEQARADLGRVDHSPERERTADGMAWSKAVGSKAASLKEMMASFEFQATWADVNSKAKRIRESGGVNIISVTDDTITAEVKGDSDTYLTSIQRVPGTKQIALWECSCPWSTYSWGRSGRWKKYEGRMCSHAQAVVYQAQSEEMFGGEISENSQPSGEKWDFPVPMTQPGAWRVAHIPFYDLPPKIATRGFLVRWRDSIHLVTDLLDNMLRLDTGEEVPASEVTHPNYSPTVGLTASLRQDASRSDYGGQHSPPSDGPPLYDLFGESMFPDDVYDHPEYYGWGDALPETVRVIREVRGKPDAMVTIYRSLPPVFYTKYPEIAADAIPQPYTATTFETGDWVAVAKRYAEDHGAGRGWEEWIEPPDRDAPISEWPEQSGWIRVDEDWPVIAAEVPARYIRNGGNDIMEWGYWGPPVAGRVVSGRMGTRLSSKTALADLDGCMVALIPPRSITEALAIEGGEPTEHMHITLAYMGKAADVDLDEVHNAVAEWAGRTPRLAAEVSGFGTFQNGKEPVLWAGFDVPGLERFREDLVDTLCRHGAVPATGHGFVPHMTLKYGPLDEEADLGGGSRQGSLRDHGATGNHEDSLLDQQAYSGSPSTSHQGVRAHVGLGQGGVRGEGGHYPRGDGGPSPVSGGMVYQAGSPSPDDQGYAHRDPSSGAIPGWVSGSRDAVLPSELTGVGRMSRLSAGGHGSVPGQETLIMTGETTMPSSDDNLDPFLFESVIVADGNKWTYYPLSGNPVEPVMAETIEVDAALFEGGTESMLNDEPEPALPSTDGADLAEDGGVTRSAVAVRGTHFVGEGGDPSQGHPAQIADPRAWLMKSSGGGGGRDRQEIAHHAKQFLAKQAVRDFSPAERATIISEGEGQVVARNLDRLSLEGTHYNDMPVSPEDDELLWI